MNWGSASGVVVITSLVGGGAGMGLAAFLIRWLQIPNMEGQSGYFAFFVTAFGLIGGFVIGLIAALTVRTGFWRAQGYAIGAVAVLAIAAGALTVVLQDNGPMLKGDKLMLEVELKCPPGWMPDNHSRSELGSGFRVQRIADTNSPDSDLGVLSFQSSPEFGGQWVADCAVRLDKTRGKYYVNVRMGRKTDLMIQLPLPRHPGEKFEQWSPWAAQGFTGQPGFSTSPAGYTYRFRIQRQTVYDSAHPDPRAAFLAARSKAIGAMTGDSPIADWLPFFEDQNQRTLASEECAHPEVAAVNARPGELAPLLRSNDDDTVRRAEYAAGTLQTIPPSLVEPLTASGRHAIELIQQARAKSLPGDPDTVAEERAYTFFFYWDEAMDRAGTTAIAGWRTALADVQRALPENIGRDGFRLIADRIAKDMEKLGSPTH